MLFETQKVYYTKKMYLHMNINVPKRLGEQYI